MGFFDKNKEPIILKESSSGKAQIEALQQLLLTVPSETKPRIQQDIKMLEYGLIGENQILFELKNSHMPMYVLHDLFLEHNGLTAQIDFVVVTEKMVFVLECKNLFGNIEITDSGDFVRTITYGKQYKKEGIYSPITQNRRHLELIKQIKMENKMNLVTRTFFDKWFFDWYKGIVVLANPKTVLYDRFAKKEIRDQVIRADQLIEYMRKATKASKELASSDREMRAAAEKLLALHKENPTDYLAKYQINDSADTPETAAQAVPPVQAEPPVQAVPPVRAAPPAQAAPPVRTASPVQTAPPVQAAPTVRTASPAQAAPSAQTGGQKPEEHSKLYRALRGWRYQQAQSENLKPYYIFYNTTLDALSEKKPQTMDQLREVAGFGDIKCQKYGEAILGIIASCSEKESLAK